MVESKYEEYKEYWNEIYSGLNPIKKWLEDKGFYCTLKPPQTCIRVWKRFLIIQYDLIMSICLRGNINVYDIKYDYLADEIIEKFGEWGIK